MKIRWFPPSWLQITTQDKVIYIDPAWIQSNFDSHPNKIIYSHWPEPMDGLPEADMPKADIILYTHHHQDHIKTATLNHLAKKDTTIIAPEQCSMFIDRVFDRVTSGDKREINGISIEVVDAYNTHDGSSTKKQHKKGGCVGYVVRTSEGAIYHAGDTDLIPEMNNISSIDIAFLPIGGTFTMNIDEAVEATRVIQPKLAIPMHYLKSDPKYFVEKINDSSISKAKLMTIGEQILLPE